MANLFGGKKSSAPKGAQTKVAPAAAPAQEPEGEEEADPAMAAMQHKMLAKQMFGSKNFANAIPGERDPYDTIGNYWQKLDRVYIHLSENPKKMGQPQLIVKKRILFADPGNPPNSLKAGARVGQVFDYTKLGAITASKGLMAKVLDCSPKEVQPADAEMLTGPDQPLAGFVVEVQVVLDPNKTGANGAPFSWVNYMRRVPFSEVLEAAKEGNLDAEVVAELFPDNSLEELAAREAAGGE